VCVSCFSPNEFGCLLVTLINLNAPLKSESTMVLTSDIENDIILQRLRFWSTEVHLVLMMVLSSLACRNYVPIKLILLPCCEMVIFFKRNNQMVVMMTL
jgi:hypothetical protein